MIQTVRKLLSLFDKKEKPRLFFIFLLMVFGAFLEAMSISVIVPVVSVMLKTDSDHPNRYYLWARQVLHIQSEHSFIIAGLLSLLFLIIFKTVYLLFEYKLQYRFVYNSRFSLQKKLLHSLFCRPYEYYLNTETGKILHVLQGDIIHTYDMLLKLLRLATDRIHHQPSDHNMCGISPAHHCAADHKADETKTKTRGAAAEYTLLPDEQMAAAIRQRNQRDKNRKERIIF